MAKQLLCVYPVHMDSQQAEQDRYQFKIVMVSHKNILKTYQKHIKHIKKEVRLSALFCVFQSSVMALQMKH